MVRPFQLILSIFLLSGLTFAATYEATRDVGCVVSPDGSFGTIQEAVDAASAGDTVIVCNDGFYVENVDVDLAINLFGHTAETPVVALSNTIPVINVSVSGTNVSNLTVSGSHGNGSFACGLLVRDAVGVDVWDFTATDNRIGVCVYESTSSNIHFDRITSYRNVYANMILGNLVGVSGPSFIFINDSSFYQSRYGIWLNRTDTVHVNNSAFYNINGNPPTTPGGSLDTAGIVARSQVVNLVVYNNQFYDNHVSMGMGCDEIQLPCVKGGAEVLVNALISENEFGNHGLASILADVDGTADHLWMIRDNNFYGDTPIHIYTDDLRNSTLMYNNFTGAGVTCIITEDSHWITYDSNRIEQCFMGMVFYEGNRNFNLSNNIFNDSYFNFGFIALDPQSYYHNISTDNTVNGIPMYYFVQGSTGDGFTTINPVPVQTGYIGLIETDNAVLHDMWDVGHNVNGLVILNSSNIDLRSFHVKANFWGAYLGVFNSTIQDFTISDSHVVSGMAASFIEYPNCGLLTWGGNTNFTNLLLNDHEICYYMAMNFGPPMGPMDISNFSIAFGHPMTELPLSGMVNYETFQFNPAIGISALISDDIDFLASLPRNLAIGPDFVSIDTTSPVTDLSFQNPANVTLLTSGCPSTYYYAAGFPLDFDSVVAGGEFTPTVTMNCTDGLSTFEVAGFSGYAAEGPPEGENDTDDSKEIELDYERLDCPSNGVELTAREGGDVLNNVEYRVLFNGLHYKTLLGKSGEYDLMLSAEGKYIVTAKKSGYDQDSVSFSFELCEKEEEKHLSCVNSACVLVAGAGIDGCSSDSECAPPPTYECTSDDDCSDAYYCDIPFSQSGGSCKPVTGDCGYAANHQWAMYECGNETNCPQCPGDKICLNNTCVLRDLEGPNEGFVGDKVTANATENENPCAFCDIEIEFPDGKKVRGKTDANGQLELPLDLKGQYAISLLGPDGYRLKTITVDSLPVEPPVDEPTPSVVQDDEFPLLWLVILLVAIAIVIAYSRRKSGKKR